MHREFDAQWARINAAIGLGLLIIAVLAICGVAYIHIACPGGISAWVERLVFGYGEAARG